MVAGTGQAQAGLGGAAGYGEITLPRSDDASSRQDWSAVFAEGLNFFGRRWAATAIFVNTNGTLSFGAALPGYPGADLPAGGLPDMIAPFWADVDTRLRGEGVESGEIHIDIDPGSDCVSVTWDNVGCYRRNTDAVNRFQVQLHDRGGGDFDIVLRYEAIGWTTGSSSADTGAEALLVSSHLLDPLALRPGSSGAALADLDSLAGNTGIAGLWLFEMRGGRVAGVVSATGLALQGTAAADTLRGGAGADILRGLAGPDLLNGAAGADTLLAGDGSDTVIGGDGNDLLRGGTSTGDRHDILYGGGGNDRIDGGSGDDMAHGGLGRDVLIGGLGADLLIGREDADTLSGGGVLDRLLGGDGADFLNGGPGNDRLNGGGGADRFFHLGLAGHGTDWVQDYSAAAGDLLVYGGPGANREQFQINLATTPGAGSDGIAEAFVVWRPTGQVLWALIDGAAQPHINLWLAGSAWDLLA